MIREISHDIVLCLSRVQYLPKFWPKMRKNTLPGLFHHPRGGGCRTHRDNGPATQGGGTALRSAGSLAGGSSARSDAAGGGAGVSVSFFGPRKASRPRGSLSPVVVDGAGVCAGARRAAECPVGDADARRSSRARRCATASLSGPGRASCRTRSTWSPVVTAPKARSMARAGVAPGVPAYGWGTGGMAAEGVLVPENSMRGSPMTPPHGDGGVSGQALVRASGNSVGIASPKRSAPGATAAALVRPPRAGARTIFITMYCVC